MKTRSSSKAIGVDNNEDGDLGESRLSDRTKSAVKKTKTHKKKSNKEAVKNEVDAEIRAEEKTPSPKEVACENKEAGTGKGVKIAHFADNVEKSEQRIVGGQWHTVIEELKG